MATLSSCPSDLVWWKFHLGELPDAEASDIQEHLTQRPSTARVKR
jgi:hypothetical protein